MMEVEYKYNDADQVSAIIARDLTKGAATDIYCMQYDYDTNGRKIRQVIKTGESDPDTSAYYVTTFNYDSRDMLVEEKYLRWDGDNDEWMVMYWARYKYDTAGNMVYRNVEQIAGGDAKSYEDTMLYSRGYQMMTLTRTDNVNLEVCTYTMGYDYNGNMTSMTRTGGGPFTDLFYEITQMEFQYDLKNRLIKYRFGGEGDWAEIMYDALGRVRERFSTGETTYDDKYYYDGRQLIQQIDSYNNAEFDYLRGPTGLDRQWNEASDKRYFYIKDPLGTVWAMIESGFTPQKSPIIRLYNYNAWGEHIDASDINFPDYDDDPNLMRYIGCRVEAFGKGTTTQRDALYHLDHRHYLPVLGRFLQREPISTEKPETGCENHPYAYCQGDPLNQSDPEGLWVILIGAAIIAALLALLALLSGCSVRKRKSGTPTFNQKWCCRIPRNQDCSSEDSSFAKDDKGNMLIEYLTLKHVTNFGTINCKYWCSYRLYEYQCELVSKSTKCYGFERCCDGGYYQGEDGKVYRAEDTKGENESLRIYWCELDEKITTKELYCHLIEDNSEGQRTCWGKHIDYPGIKKAPERFWVCTKSPCTCPLTAMHQTTGE